MWGLGKKGKSADAGLHYHFISPPCPEILYTKFTQGISYISAMRIEEKQPLHHAHAEKS